jgi:colicin import membrane protein
MSTTSPQPDASSAAPASKKPRNVWVWISAGLALVAIGLLVWGLRAQSDLDGAHADVKSAEQELASANQELTKAEQEISSTKALLADAADATPTATATPTSDEGRSDEETAALVAVSALFTGLARELGATREEAESTEQELAETQKVAEEAEQDAAAAKQDADDAADEAAKAKAQTEQANAERDAARAKATIAADCAKAYIAAFAGLFTSGDVRGQAPAVRTELSGITEACKAAFAGA